MKPASTYPSTRPSLAAAAAAAIQHVGRERALVRRVRDPGGGAGGLLARVRPVRLRWRQREEPGGGRGEEETPLPPRGGRHQARAPRPDLAVRPRRGRAGRAAAAALPLKSGRVVMDDHAISRAAVEAHQAVRVEDWERYSVGRTL